MEQLELSKMLKWYNHFGRLLTVSLKLNIYLPTRWPSLPTSKYLPNKYKKYMSTLRYAYNVHSCFIVLLQSGNNPKCSSTGRTDQFWNTQVGYYSVIRRSKLLIYANYINQPQDNYADWEARPPPLKVQTVRFHSFLFQKI